MPIRYTTASTNYDGFGTRTLDPEAGMDRSHTVRKVEIDDRHLQWQESRYGSGLHSSLDEAQWQRLCAAGVCVATDPIEQRNREDEAGAEMAMERFDGDD